jgi:hypothetical protein
MRFANFIQLLLLIAVFASQTTAFAQSPEVEIPEVEIDYLLTAIGSSDCTFIRNNTRHTAADAEDHLRMKYGKTKRYIDSAEEFITKLASESSWTGKAYAIECPDSGLHSSGDWLSARLTTYRQQN